MRYTIILAIIIGISVACNLSAAPNADRKADKAARAELKTSMRTWFERDVAPRLRQMQATYDASLTPDQLATVRRLRASAAELRRQHRAEAASIRSSRIDPETQRERLHALRERMHEARHSIMTELHPIMKASKESLRNIATSEQSSITAWRQQAADLIASWKAGHPNAPSPRHGGKALPLIGADRKRAAAAFVLWDGVAPDDDNDADPLAAPIAPSGNGRPQMQQLPNGPTTLELFDMNGNRMSSMQILAGQTLPSDASILSNLPSGTYMLSTINAQGTRTTRLLQHQR